MNYKLLLAGAVGALIGSAATAYVCYTMWYKNQNALISELDQSWDEVSELTQKNAELLEENGVLEQRVKSYSRDVEDLKEKLTTRTTEPIDYGSYSRVPEEDSALCEEDGPEEIPVNKCANPRFIIGTDEDVIDYWNGIYGEIEVYRDPYGSLYTEDDYGYHKAFYPDQLGGTGNLIACMANELCTVLDNARGVVFHIHQVHEDEMEPDVYENELDDYYMY